MCPDYMLPISSCLVNALQDLQCLGYHDITVMSSARDPRIAAYDDDTMAGIVLRPLKPSARHGWKVVGWSAERISRHGVTETLSSQDWELSDAIQNLPVVA